MKLPIIHISDIHFRTHDEPMLEQARSMAAAVKGTSIQMATPIIVVSGDLAYSGKTSEYKKAEQFLTVLSSELDGADVIVVPGNHDCDFAKDDATRRALVDSVVAGGEVDESVVLNCTATQNAFFDFLATRWPEAIRAPMDRLAYVIEIVRAGRTFRFTCYNTAWISKKHEQQQISVPEVVFKSDNDRADVECAVTHHPNGWLRADNARRFRNHLESTADIVFTGHEHAPSTFLKVHTDGHGALYSEAAAVRGHGDEPTGFAVQLIDCEALSQKSYAFQWNGVMYEQTKESPTSAVRVARACGLEWSQAFQAQLNDIGAPFTHPWKTTKVQLRDLFVYPDVELRPYEQKDDEDSLVAGAEFLDFIIDKKGVLVTGADESGKTSLAKIVCDDLARRGLYPVLVQGEMITATAPDGYMELITRLFVVQYDSDSSFEVFRQMSGAKRALIVDDVDCARVNTRALDRFIAWAKAFFGVVVCFASELFEFRGVAAVEGGEHALRALRPCRIKELGYVLRGRMIEKWYTLGREDVVTEEELADSVDAAERTMDTVLGRNLCPAHPVFILAVLQTWEANQSIQTVSGSYGQVYEALIARALTSKSQRIPADAKYTILSMIAFFVFENGKRWFDSSELDCLLKAYEGEFGLAVDRTAFEKDLCSGQILVKSDGVYKFSHKYVFFYFTAKYIRDFIGDRGDGDRLAAIVTKLTENVHQEESANVLIFLVYLTKSDVIIDGFVASASELFADSTACDLNESIRFINDFAKGHAPERLNAGSVEHSREEFRRHRDRRAAVAVKAPVVDERDEILHLNRAVKTIQVLGQILRNFPGSLRSDRKLRVARETYALGLRALGFVFRQLEEGWEETRVVISDFLRSQHDFEDEYELQQSTDEFMFLQLRAFAHFFVRKISYAVGSEHLQKTYEQLLDESPTVAVRLIDTAIKLDHFRPMNVDGVVGLNKALRKNFLASSILRRLVRNHLYLYPVPIKRKQSVCARLDISFDNVGFLNPVPKVINR